MRTQRFFGFCLSDNQNQLRKVSIKFATDLSLIKVIKVSIKFYGMRDQLLCRCFHDRIFQTTRGKNAFAVDRGSIHFPNQSELTSKVTTKIDDQSENVHAGRFSLPYQLIPSNWKYKPRRLSKLNLRESFVIQTKFSPNKQNLQPLSYD